MKKQLLLLVLMMLPVVACAHDIEVQNADGKTIYYNYINDGAELEVTFRGTSFSEYYNEYTGNLVIPAEVTYMNITRKVTRIGQYAFYYCSGLTSVTIDSNVTSIGDYAFNECSGLISVSIPNSVSSIGSWAFQNCFDLRKVIVPDIAAWCGINFNAEYNNPLSCAHHLYSDENTEIKELVIPNSVTSIGEYVFHNCQGLTSVTIPNSVTSIDKCAFSGCSGLSSIIFPNSVTSIGMSAFEYCSGLTSVTIGNSVTSIGNYAFYGADILTVVSLIENPFTIVGKTWSSRTFTLNTFNNATLYVPVGTKEKYKATAGWKDFLFIEEGIPAGIDAVEKIRNNNITIYDLNGVRQPEVKKGINIINGKKVVVK